MKKYATSYPVEGTSALRLEPVEPGRDDATIIAFPGLRRSARSADSGFDGSRCAVHSSGFEPAKQPVFKSKLVAELCAGDAGGKSFGRMRPWQAAVGGFALCATAFAGLFLTL